MGSSGTANRASENLARADLTVDERREATKAKAVLLLEGKKEAESARVSEHDVPQPARTHIRVPTGNPPGRPKAAIAKAAEAIGVTPRHLRRVVKAAEPTAPAEPAAPDHHGETPGFARQIGILIPAPPLYPCGIQFNFSAY